MSGLYMAEVQAVSGIKPCPFEPIRWPVDSIDVPPVFLVYSASSGQFGH